MQILEQSLFLVSDSAQQLYLDTLKAIQYYGEDVSSVCEANSVGSGWGMRDRPTKELRHVSLVLKNPRNRLFTAPGGRFESMVSRALLATLSDEIEIDALSFYDARAKEFSDDGKQVPTNYGNRIRHFENINQIEQVIDQFRRDRNTRRAVIHIHTASDADSKYDPCIDSLHFLIRNEQLECHSHWRSENALTLLPVNIFEFTLLQELIASELNVGLGPYVHTVTSLHYYLDDEQRLEKVVEAHTGCAFPMDPMPAYSTNQVDLIREYEKKWRLDPGSIGQDDAGEQLSEYWQGLANVIAYTIARKTGQWDIAMQLAKTSPWRGLLVK